ncbi:amidohydrolase [Yinghuangia aomiensis]|uniref:Amidohydrolase n=1 Tax=Yinghuangia aomiensis TaxID=676205 RepID=A0ABP9I5Z5_9ACTN
MIRTVVGMSRMTGMPRNSYADRIFTGGPVVTVDPERPFAQAVAVAGGRITAVGETADMAGVRGPDTEIVDLEGRCLMPGFVEPHGHPTEDAVVLGDRIADIRPVTLRDPDDVFAAILAEVDRRGPDGAWLYGWDPLLQRGLPEPTLDWLDGLAPHHPLVIMHNSGHQAYFNTAAARSLGLDRDTPDPVGAHYGRDDDGGLDGTAYETAAIGRVLAPALPADFPAALNSTYARFNAAGITMASDMAFTPALRGAVAASTPTVRLRLYEVSNPQRASDLVPDNGDDLVRQVGIKMWADGSPWVGNIATSFPYLDTPSTRAIGLDAHHRGHANYTPEQLADLAEAYFPKGWQLACHVHGDDAVTMVLDVWEDLLRRHPRPDHRLRLEHVGTMRPDQYRRAAALGVTCSIFVDHLYYWGNVMVDGLFGIEHGTHYALAGSALESGMRISFHNDGPVTPLEPLRNIATAVTRATSSGRVLAPEERITLDRAIRAQTLDAAWQMFADDVTGSIALGKYADLVVLDEDPYRTPAEDLPGIGVHATYLAGLPVFQAD